MVLHGVIIFLTVVIIILILINCKRCNCNSEGYTKCVCSSRNGGEQNCQDSDEVVRLYNENKLTEYTDLQGPGWTTTSPGDLDYPHSNGCKWGDTGSPGWGFWDFTDF